jgi:hypothetical protein
MTQIPGARIRFVQLQPNWTKIGGIGLGQCSFQAKRLEGIPQGLKPTMILQRLWHFSAALSAGFEFVP